MLEDGEGDRRDRVAMSPACHGAIHAGKTLSLDEMRELVRQLEESEAPTGARTEADDDPPQRGRRWRVSSGEGR